MQPGYPGYIHFTRFDPPNPFIDTISETMKDFVHRFISIEERLQVAEKALQEKDNKIKTIEEEFKSYKQATDVKIESLECQIEELKS
jgi:hypothetical protein